MAIHFYPKVGGRVDFDTPEEAARFFEITGGGTIEAPKPEVRAAQVVSAAPSTTAPKAKRKPSSLKQRLEDSIQIVMGNQEMSAPIIHEKIKAKDWLPDSKDPLSYIRYTLSSNKAIFKCKSRGWYHLDPSNPYTVGEHEVPIEGHVNPKTTKVTKAKPSAATIKPVVVPPKVEPPKIETKVEEPPEVVEPPEVEVASEDPIEDTKPVSAPPEVVEPEMEDVDSLVARLSQEDPAPQVTEAPEPQVEAAPPTPKLTVVEPPKVEESADPVLDILNEFSNELNV